MKVLAEQGYLIIAQNSLDIDYVQCAKTLARSIKEVQPSASVCLLTDTSDNADVVFDHLVTFPFGDQAGDSEWKLQNDWQCFYASPYRETIKLEADMIVPVSIEHWFEICRARDLVVATGARNYRGELGTERAYRKIFDANALPDVYNAVTYWRLSRDAKEFFDTVREIMCNWEQVMSLLRMGQGQPLNTDLAYAIAVRLLGDERYTLPDSPLGMTHMKPRFNNLKGSDWRRELVWERGQHGFRIQTIQQQWPVHYYHKDFAGEFYHDQ